MADDCIAQLSLETKTQAELRKIALMVFERLPDDKKEAALHRAQRLLAKQKRRASHEQG